MNRIVSGLFSYVRPELDSPGLFKKPDTWDQNLKPDRPDGEGTGLVHLRHDVREAIQRAQEALLSLQDDEGGFWSVELRADTTLESDYMMLLYFLDRADPVKVQKLARYILSQQLPDGGWPIYRNGPSQLSVTVKAYWALKLAHYPVDHEALVRARGRIRELGGIHRVNSYTKAYLALFGLYDWRGVPTIPPEIMLFPKWFYFNLYEVSYWTRAIVIPLSIVWAIRPLKVLPARARLDELFPSPQRFVPVGWNMGPGRLFSWQKFFLIWDAALKWLEGKGPHFIRSWSLRLAERWMLERLEGSDGLGAIFPGIVNSVLAMKALGYPDTDPRLRKQLEELERLEIDRGDHIEMQPCFSPVWDTSISMIALAESGLRRDHPALIQATQWLLSKEVRREGDWKVKNPRGPRGGWAFEFNNEWYPDVDDTAMVMLALRHVYLEDDLSQKREKACLRGLHWLLSMQCRGGGWAAFDKDNSKWIFTKIPFADHNAMIDPPTSDVTARVLEFLGYIGYDKGYPCVQRAVEFLKNQQEGDGSWYGRWGVNYLYGTWQALRGLAAIGEDADQTYVQKAIQWLRQSQHPDGGWGETCSTYVAPEQKGSGPSTPSQTAWALMGLMSFGQVYDPQVEKGVQYLLSTQKPNGNWEETEFTGTGFPKVFYLEYTLYRNYFPLMVLGMHQRLRWEFHTNLLAASKN